MSKIEPAPPLESIGLGAPAYRVSVTMSNGSKVDFHIGAKTVTQSGYYLRTADGNLVVTAAYNIDSLIELTSQPPFLQTATPEATPQASPTP